MEKKDSTLRLLLEKRQLVICRMTVCFQIGRVTEVVSSIISLESDVQKVRMSQAVR